MLANAVSSHHPLPDFKHIRFLKSTMFTLRLRESSFFVSCQYFKENSFLYMWNLRENLFMLVVGFWRKIHYCSWWDSKGATPICSRILRENPSVILRENHSYSRPDSEIESTSLYGGIIRENLLPFVLEFCENPIRFMLKIFIVGSEGDSTFVHGGIST